MSGWQALLRRSWENKSHNFCFQIARGHYSSMIIKCSWMVYHQESNRFLTRLVFCWSEIRFGANFRTSTSDFHLPCFESATRSSQSWSFVRLSPWRLSDLFTSFFKSQYANRRSRILLTSELLSAFSIFFRISVTHRLPSVVSLSWSWKSPYPHVRIAASIHVLSVNCRN